MGVFDERKYKGKRFWAVAQGYISSEQEGSSQSKELICILNTTDKDAKVEIMTYFPHQDPIGPYEIDVQAKRLKHIDLSELTTPKDIPLDTQYSYTIESVVPIIVQHAHLDLRHKQSAMSSTIAYSE